MRLSWSNSHSLRLFRSPINILFVLGKKYSKKSQQISVHIIFLWSRSLWHFDPSKIFLQTCTFLAWENHLKKPSLMMFIKAMIVYPLVLINVLLKSPHINLCLSFEKYTQKSAWVASFILVLRLCWSLEKILLSFFNSSCKNTFEKSKLSTLLVRGK